MNSNEITESIHLWEKILFFLLSLSELIFNLLISLIYLVYALLHFLYLALSKCRKPRKKDPFGMIRGLKISKKTLMLDLDGTLIFTDSSEKPLSSKLIINGKVLYVQQRPHLNEFLVEVLKAFNVGIFTSSKQDYADQVIKVIGMDKAIPKHMRFYRNHCSVVNGNYMKMLSIVEADLRNVLILDNRPEVIVDKRNVVKIKSWEGGEDSELMNCLLRLKEKSCLEDVRFCN